VQDINGWPPVRRCWRIREHPPSMLRNVDDEPLGRRCWRI
jgi:hypothetical protein